MLLKYRITQRVNFTKNLSFCQGFFQKSLTFFLKFVIIHLAEELVKSNLLIINNAPVCANTGIVIAVA